MQIKNMEAHDVEAFKELFGKLKEQNPDLVYKTFTMDDTEEPRPGNTQLEARITDLENLIKHIFGNHVLVNGQFVRVDI